MFGNAALRTGTVVVVLTLGVWVLFYWLYGPQGQLDAAETTVVALLMALLVVGVQSLRIKLRGPAKSSDTEGKTGDSGAKK